MKHKYFKNLSKEENILVYNFLFPQEITLIGYFYHPNGSFHDTAVKLNKEETKKYYQNKLSYNDICIICNNVQ